MLTDRLVELSVSLSLYLPTYQRSMSLLRCRFPCERACASQMLHLRPGRVKSAPRSGTSVACWREAIRSHRRTFLTTIDQDSFCGFSKYSGQPWNRPQVGLPQARQRGLTPIHSACRADPEFSTHAPHFKLHRPTEDLLPPQAVPVLSTKPPPLPGFLFLSLRLKAWLSEELGIAGLR